MNFVTLILGSLLFVSIIINCCISSFYVSEAKKANDLEQYHDLFLTYIRELQQREIETTNRLYDIMELIDKLYNDIKEKEN